MSWHHQLVVELCDEINDSDNPLRTQMSGCGQQLSSLLSLTSALSADIDTKHSCEILDALIQHAYDKLSKGESITAWRRMYTDASILRAIADLSEDSARSAIATLDKSIIIAGTAGEGRYDLVIFLIAAIQRDFLTRCVFNTSPVRPSAHLDGPVILDSSSSEIPSYGDPPSFVAFQEGMHQQPFILRRYAMDWPALTDHAWNSIDYLLSAAGPARIVPVEVGTDYRTEDWTQKLMPWEEFLTSLNFDALAEEEAPAIVLYLAQHNLLGQFPSLRRDIMIPDYVYTSLKATAAFPFYEPPKNEDQLVLNAWLGPKGTVSPAHTDPYFNLYVQLAGRKTIWLAPPAASRYMYPTNSAKMSNTSRVDVFAPHTNEYCEFWENVAPRAMSATLEAGDMLFFPPGWWHAMRAETSSFSVSMWF